MLSRVLAGAGALVLVAGLLAASAPAKRTTPAQPRRRATAAPRPAPKPPTTAALLQLGKDARAFEESGAYGLAADKLRALRARVAPDADLELALALDEARSGQLDSAWARLHRPVLEAARVDTAGWARRHDYGFEREPLWINGRFDGWNWYVARARAELALRRGVPFEGLDDASWAVRARPLSGKDVHLAALLAAHAGSLARAGQLARVARTLDPTLPESHYLHGLLEWRAGRRNEAGEAFRAAMALDSSFREPALANVRSRLPASAPDAFPTRFLFGARAAGELTSPVQPKIEEVNQTEFPVTLVAKRTPEVPDSLRRRFGKPVHLIVTVLVDERGHPILNELPWFPEDAFPYSQIPAILASTVRWEFRPAQKHGQPAKAWGSVEHVVQP